MFARLRSALSLLVLLALAPMLARATPIGNVIVGYGGGADRPGLYEVDPATGNSTFLTAVQPYLFGGGLAYLNGNLYASDYRSTAGQPATTYGLVNIMTGQFTAIGSQGTSQNWYGLTSGPALNTLYVAQEDDNTLLSFTPGGAVTVIGTTTGVVSSEGIRGMAFDSANGTMYATDYYSASPNLYTINLQTGAASLVGSLGFPVHSFGGDVPLAYDPNNETIYAFESVSRSLYALDLQTGHATIVGATGAVGVPLGSATWVPASSVPPISSVPEPNFLWMSALLVGGLLAFQAIGSPAWNSR